MFDVFDVTDNPDGVRLARAAMAEVVPPGAVLDTARVVAGQRTTGRRTRVEFSPHTSPNSTRSLVAPPACGVQPPCEPEFHTRARGAAGDRRGPLPLRWVYLHMLRELAQHCGHADILREQLLTGEGG